MFAYDTKFCGLFAQVGLGLMKITTYPFSYLFILFGFITISINILLTFLFEFSDKFVSMNYDVIEFNDHYYYIKSVFDLGW